MRTTTRSRFYANGPYPVTANSGCPERARHRPTNALSAPQLTEHKTSLSAGWKKTPGILFCSQCALLRSATNHIRSVSRKRQPDTRASRLVGHVRRSGAASPNYYVAKADQSGKDSGEGEDSERGWFSPRTRLTATSGPYNTFAHRLHG